MKCYFAVLAFSIASTNLFESVKDKIKLLVLDFIKILFIFRLILKEVLFKLSFLKQKLTF
jgi:hypothetical protein